MKKQSYLVLGCLVVLLFPLQTRSLPGPHTTETSYRISGGFGATKGTNGIPQTDFTFPSGNIGTVTDSHDTTNKAYLGPVRVTLKETYPATIPSCPNGAVSLGLKFGGLNIDAVRQTSPYMPSLTWDEYNAPSLPITVTESIACNGAPPCNRIITVQDASFHLAPKHSGVQPGGGMRFVMPAFCGGNSELFVVNLDASAEQAVSSPTPLPTVSPIAP